MDWGRKRDVSVCLLDGEAFKGGALSERQKEGGDGRGWHLVNGSVTIIKDFSIVCKTIELSFHYFWFLNFLDTIRLPI